MKIKRKVFHIGRIIDYSLASKSFSGVEDSFDYCYPTIIPNWDHSPRSGRNGHILVNSNPKIFFLLMFELCLIQLKKKG